MTIRELLDCSYKERKKSQHDVSIDFEKYAAGMNSMDKVLAQPNTEQGKKSIYIHIPYCKKICSFCNMRRTINPIPSEYTDLVIRQIEAYGKTEYVQTSTITSVYFGGGTPTALQAHELVRLLQALYNNFNIDKNAEISMETTVSELDNEKLSLLFQNGLNRFSIGVQTFNDKGRKTLGRIGSGTEVEQVIKKVFETGFRNVNIDIIYNYPHETEAMVREDVQTAFRLDIAGFSFYSLIVTGESKIGTLYENNDEKRIENDAQFFLAIIDESRKAGYDFLEITKLVKPGRDNYEYIRSSHTAGDIFPVGAGAGGSINNTGFMNPLKIDGFSEKAIPLKVMGMAVKPDYKRIKQFSGLLQEGTIALELLSGSERNNISALIPRLEKEGLIYRQQTEKYYTFTDKGFFWGNSLAADVVKNIFYV